MNIPIKKLKSGFSMPVYGLGTWQMGGLETRIASNDDGADIFAIKNAIEMGITHIDTAESYADGYTEELVGKGIKDFDRSKLLLVSKAKAEHLGYDDLIMAAKGSLKRLGTTYLDVYLCHRYNAEIPIQETMRGMDTLINEGLIRHIGVSNFTKEEFEEAQSYTKNKIVMNQLHYNLQIREVEKKGLVSFCQENDVLLVAWRPMQKGMLLEEKSQLVLEMMKKYQKTFAQIAINWLISQENVVTLSKTRDEKHLEENLGAVGWEMDPEDIELLRKEFPNQQTISNAVPLH